MKSVVIQEFKGTINGIEISDRDDFIKAYTSIFYDLESEYLYDFRSHMSSSSWDIDLKDITRLHFDIGSYYDTDAQFSEINKNIRNWKNTYSKYPINLLKKK